MTLSSYFSNIVTQYTTHLLVHSVNNSTTSLFSWFSMIHITGAGLIIGAFVLLVVGKKIVSAVLNLAVIILFLMGIASVLGFNLLKLL